MLVSTFRMHNACVLPSSTVIFIVINSIDLDRISPYTISAMSRRQVMRIQKNVN